MNIEIIDRKLIITPDTLDELTKIYALAAAYTAYNSVIYPVSGEPLRCTEACTSESEKPPQIQGFEPTHCDR